MADFMRVLWLVRENLQQHPGGDTTQILRTADALRARGVDVTLCSDPRPSLAGYDLVHLFHLDRLWENEPHCRQIRESNTPVVLSTIYWPPDEFDRGGRHGLQGWLARRLGSRTYENLRLVQRWALHAGREGPLRSLTSPLWRFREAARFVLETVRVWLPNSAAEQHAIEERFAVRRPAVIVPNAADAGQFAGAHDETSASSQRDQEQPRQGVLCVGRIEPRKNQLALIQALRDSNLPLTLVGSPGRYSGAYYRRCVRSAGTNVRILGQQPARALGTLYRSARVHACVSWYETPGLASLEAALCGCAVVVTPGGCTQEYFGDEAHYCRPDDPPSIRAGVEAALAAVPSHALQHRVACEYTWDRAAQKTLEGYELALTPARGK